MTDEKKAADHQIKLSGLDDLFKEAEASVDKYAPEKDSAEPIPAGEPEAGSDAKDAWDLEQMDLEAIEVVNGPATKTNPPESDAASSESKMKSDESSGAESDVDRASTAQDAEAEERADEDVQESAPEPEGPTAEEALMQAMLREKNRMTLAISRLEHEKKDLKQERERYKESLVRVSANFENFKKRVQRDKDEVYKYAQDEVLKVLFDVADNLERATRIDLEEAGEAEKALAVNVLEGVNMTLRSVQASLNKLEVSAFSALDRFFDPNFHEAVQRVENSDVPEGWVVEEYYQGYLQKGRLIRAALVVVAYGGMSRKEWEALNASAAKETSATADEASDTQEGAPVGDTSEASRSASSSSKSSEEGLGEGSSEGSSEGSGETSAAFEPEEDASKASESASSEDGEQEPD